MKYNIRHKTTYRYSAAVNQSYHLLHLTPCVVSNQTVLRHRITTAPHTELRYDLTDFFGNPYSILALEKDHKELIVEADSEIEVFPASPPDLGVTLDWQRLSLASAGVNLTVPPDVVQYAVASRHGKRLTSLLDFALPSFPPGQPILVGAQDLMRRIHTDFTFDASATDVSTPVEVVLQDRRGVCQDFAHLMISALRSINVPARYVSGYIRTVPPEGQPRLQGADASHAWVSVWAPDVGWVDFDPTNNAIPQGDHITICYGRDYDDVAPISGVLLGGGAHTVDVAVDVIPQDES